MTDRITTLLNSFHLQARSTPVEHSNLAGFQDHASGHVELVFTPRTIGISPKEQHILFSLKVDFGISTSPLLAALPDQVVENVCPRGDLASIVSLLKSEHETGKCGAPVVLSRLGDVLVVSLLRMQLDRGVATPGLLAGLANPRISKAIMAMHEAPGESWPNSQLAKTAGLSHTRFKELFT
ncbi:MAG: cupin domain-containing protein, partial [Pseudomonadota bacterium]